MEKQHLTFQLLMGDYTIVSEYYHYYDT